MNETISTPTVIHGKQCLAPVSRFTNRQIRAIPRGMAAAARGGGDKASHRGGKSRKKVFTRMEERLMASFDFVRMNWER